MVTKIGKDGSGYDAANLVTDMAAANVAGLPTAAEIATANAGKIGIDAVQLAVIGIDEAHHHIHDGYAFSAYCTVTTASTDAHRTGLFITTPSVATEIHALISYSASGAATFTVNEGVTFDVNEGSNAQVIYNRDRNSNTTSLCLDNATSPAANKFAFMTEAEMAAGNFATGTVIRTETVQTGLGPKPIGGDSRDTQELILKAATKYIFLLTNVGASANVHRIYMDWYEVV